MHNELKSKILSEIKSHSVLKNISFENDKSFQAFGITFQNICNALDESNAKLERLREIKREVVNLEEDGIIIYIFGEPPFYILKDTIKYV